VRIEVTVPFAYRGVFILSYILSEHFRAWSEIPICKVRWPNATLERFTVHHQNEEHYVIAQFMHLKRVPECA